MQLRPSLINMTHPLHPKSRLTTSLFSTTLLVSFLVVALPHILPCHAPRVRFADAESEVAGRDNCQNQPRDGAQDADATSDGNSNVVKIISDGEQSALRRKGHECPVPKPQGFVGRMLGFNGASSEASRASRLSGPEVRVRDCD